MKNLTKFEAVCYMFKKKIILVGKKILQIKPEIYRSIYTKIILSFYFIYYCCCLKQSDIGNQ